MSKTLANKINPVLMKVDEGDYGSVLNQLTNDILKKMNGAADEGAPDKNDWIVDSNAQNQVYPLILVAINLLGNLS